MLDPLPFVISALTALLTPTIAVVTAYIAIQQYRINREEKALNLYERRLRVYTAMHSILDYIGGGNGVDYNKYCIWLRSVSEAEFIFGDEVSYLLKSLSEAVGDYYQNSCPDFLPNDEMARSHAAIRIASYNAAIIDTFRPYLSSNLRQRYMGKRLSKKQVDKLIPVIDPRVQKIIDGDGDIPF